MKIYLFLMVSFLLLPGFLCAGTVRKPNVATSIAETVILVDGTLHPPSGEKDPGCYDKLANPTGGNCKPLCVYIPGNGQGVETKISVAEADDGKWFGPCPRSNNNKFLDCGGIPRTDRPPQKDFGWIRIYPVQYSRKPIGNGWDSVCYETVNNWATRGRNVKLTVNYF